MNGSSYALVIEKTVELDKSIANWKVITSEIRSQLYLAKGLIEPYERGESALRDDYLRIRDNHFKTLYIKIVDATMELSSGRLKKAVDACLDLLLKTNINKRLIFRWTAGAEALEIIKRKYLRSSAVDLFESGDIERLSKSLNEMLKYAELSDRFMNAISSEIFKANSQMMEGKNPSDLKMDNENIQIFDEIIVEACK